MTNETQSQETPRLSGVERAREVVERMVATDGCAWHTVQTHETLTKYLIEEAYEVVDAIEQGPRDTVPEELGDVLYQVLFHTALAERDGEGYTLDTVGERLADKLIARHPHVFGDRGYMSEDELNAEWEHLKEDAEGEARGSRHPLEGIPQGMETLARAAKTIERLKRAHLLNPGEHINEGDGGSTQPPTDETSLGDAMVELLIRANALGIDPDRALRLATARISKRLIEQPQADVQ